MTKLAGLPVPVESITMSPLVYPVPVALTAYVETSVPNVWFKDDSTVFEDSTTYVNKSLSLNLQSAIPIKSVDSLTLLFALKLEI